MARKIEERCEVLTPEHDMAIAHTSSQQLWLPAQYQDNQYSKMNEGGTSPHASHGAEEHQQWIVTKGERALLSSGNMAAGRLFMPQWMTSKPIHTYLVLIGLKELFSTTKMRI